MNDQQQNPVTEEKRICKNCEKRLPNKSYFCMYCGTDNAPTSVQVEYEKANNESLKKYKILDTQKQSPLWYIIFLLLIIDVIVLNVLLIMNNDKMFVTVNSARFQNYEKSFYLGEEAYLALKDNKLKVIGANRLTYSNITNEVSKHEFKDVQIIYDYFGDSEIYALDTEDYIYKIEGTSITQIETEDKFIDIYHYLNSKEINCYEDTEYIVLDNNVYYYDVAKNEVKQAGDGKFEPSKDRFCSKYPRTTVVSADELDLKNPKLIYQSNDGSKIILKGAKELVEIFYGRITSRVSEIKIKDDVVKVENIKEIFYIDDEYLIIDKNDKIYSTEEPKESTSLFEEENITLNSDYFKEQKREQLFELIGFIVILLIDLMFLYKMSDKGTFSKIMSLSGMFMVEIVLYMIFKAGGIDVGSGQLFMLLLKLLFIIYLLLIIVSTVIVQIAELTIKLLDFIKFRNIFSYVFVMVAVTITFVNALLSGNNGVFLSIFLLGTYWSYLTESEDIDVDLFITTKSQLPIIILSVLNIILYFSLLNMFRISNYFVVLLLLTVLFGIYLAIRPELTKKELTGKSIKSLLVVIMSLVFTFVTTLLSMNLFSSLTKDYEGIVMKSVLSIGLKNVLYLVVAFAVLVIISSIMRILHTIIKKVCKNTNSVVQYLIFSIISMILFTLIIYFYPEIINIIDAGVSNIFNLINK